MGLDLWFREDVVRLLAATLETMRASTWAVQDAGATAGSQEVADAYRQGFGDAVRAVGVAFGVALPGEPHVTTSPKLPDGGDLLRPARRRQIDDLEWKP
jgi:hypothetical protein